MKRKECVLILTLAMAGVICSAGPALATPLLDSDMASSMVLGASKATRANIDALGGDHGNGSGVSVQAISTLGAQAAAAIPGLQGEQGLAEQGLAAASLASAQTFPGSPGSGAARNKPGSGGTTAPGPELATQADHAPATLALRDDNPGRIPVCDIARVRTAIAGLDLASLAALCNDVTADGNGISGTPPARVDLVSFDPAAADSNGAGNDGLTNNVSDFTAAVGGTSDPGNLLVALAIDDGLALPEPSTLLLLAASLAGLAWRRRRSSGSQSDSMASPLAAGASRR